MADLEQHESYTLPTLDSLAKRRELLRQEIQPPYNRQYTVNVDTLTVRSGTNFNENPKTEVDFLQKGDIINVINTIKLPSGDWAMQIGENQWIKLWIVWTNDPKPFISLIPNNQENDIIKLKFEINDMILRLQSDVRYKFYLEKLKWATFIIKGKDIHINGIKIDRQILDNFRIGWGWWDNITPREKNKLLNDLQQAQIVEIISAEPILKIEWKIIPVNPKVHITLNGEKYKMIQPILIADEPKLEDFPERFDDFRDRKSVV